MYLVLFLAAVRFNHRFKDILYEHLPAAVGVPLSVLTALALVFGLEHVAGNVEFKAWGLEFKGAAGPLVMWILCFLVLVGGIKILW